MLFTEKKTSDGFEYWTQDVFGEVHIHSTTKLVADILDNMVGLILSQQPGVETVTGEVKHDDGIVSYSLTRAPLWEEDDQEDETEICTNTPTSTLKLAIERIQNVLLRIPGIRSLQRFVGAFREAWRNRR